MGKDDNHIPEYNSEYHPGYDEGYGKKPLRHIRKSGYRSENNLVSWTEKGYQFYAAPTSRVSEWILYSLRKKGEEKWNDAFSQIRYKTSRKQHVINIHNDMVEKAHLEIPELDIPYTKERLTVQRLKLEQEKNATPIGAVTYLKRGKDELMKLTGYIARDLSRMHQNDLASFYPAAPQLTVFPDHDMIMFNNLPFVQYVRKQEDKARDSMQFLISLYHNSGESIYKLGAKFFDNYAIDPDFADATEKVISYDESHLKTSPLEKTLRKMYQQSVFGVDQYEALRLKKSIYNVIKL